MRRRMFDVRRGRLATAVLVLVAVALTTTTSAQGQASRFATPPDLDAYVARVMDAFEVPGIALAIVSRDEVVLTQGYGVRTVGEPEPVDDRTLFGIASNSKAFTSTALGLLVEDGVLEWDAPVIRYLPWSQMWDPFVTRELTVRDLLVHRSGLGLGAGDLLWWPASSYTRGEIARRLRFIEPATSFRSAYAYDNVLNLVAGEVIEAVSGQPWEAFVSTRLLDRLGMTETRPRYPEPSRRDNLATPHARVEGVVRPVTPFDSDNVNPAGGIHSNAREMASWLRVQLAHGQLPDGARLFSDQTSTDLWSIVTPRRIAKPAPELAETTSSFFGYALGFNVLDYRGRRLITHTGGLPGYVSRLAMLPDDGVGLVVLTNQESGAAFDSIMYRVLDHALGAPEKDWIAAFETVTDRRAARTAATEQQASAARDADSTPSLPLERYARTYRDAWYGDITIAMDGERLVMRFGHTASLVGDLEHWQHDTFVVRWRARETRADAFVTFALTPDGQIDQARMEPVSPATDFSYDFKDLLLRPVP